MLRHTVILSLKGARAFRRLRRAQSLSGPFFSVRYMPHLEQPSDGRQLERRTTDHTQSVVYIGIITSKKVGKAHARNRVRRRLKEALKLIVQHYKVRMNQSDVVIIAKSSAAEASYAELERSLIELLIKGRFLRKEVLEREPTSYEG